MPKKLEQEQASVDEAVDRFRGYWSSLTDEEREIAENVTVLTVYAGGRKAAADAMGVGATTLDNYRSGKTQPKYLELIRLAQYAQRVQGQILKNMRLTDVSASDSGKSHVVQEKTVATVTVDHATVEQLVDKIDRMAQEIGTMRRSLDPPPPPPATIKFLPQAASAGWGRAVLDDEGVEELDMTAFASRLLGIEADHITLVPVIGYSMDPTLQDGDYAVVDRRKRKIEDGAVFVVSNDNDLYIKRAKRGDDGACCWLSDNIDQEQYKPICLVGDELRRMKVVGRVTNVLRRL